MIVILRQKSKVIKMKKMFNETDKNHIKYKYKCGCNVWSQQITKDYVSFNLK